MSTFFRDRIEATIEHLIAVLDEMDGDTDREPEPIEEQHDREAVPLRASPEFVLAEVRRRYRKTHH
ncbi:hypothetical protein [Mesorhizobium sp. LNJC394B00]|uniref:hypothetical protein n=1 Tax=Mesorhizobium sp. LNJC394B00 TaxID=1287274 RepID=UPI0003CED17C|nr:hypothetical protein [Mesorhizobium sp. LNJC394B00]ESY15181.1 hypothetical protein X750_29325 [Mesorhizobium sp. LNJC394B00]